MGEEIQFKILKHGENPFELKSPFSRNKTAHIRKRLFNLNPRCHWCGKLTIFVEGNGICLPDNAATVDHIVSRLMATSKAHHRSAANIVLACYKCNTNRADEEHTLLQN